MPTDHYVFATWSPKELRAALDSFNPSYVDDWDRWLQTPLDLRPEAFVRTLGRWQAARPGRLRRLSHRREEHAPPYIEDLLEKAAQPLGTFDRFQLGRQSPTPLQRRALGELWRVFRRLRQDDRGTCVAITKAVLLLTDGRVGPALDSTVRRALGVRRLDDAESWADLLAQVSRDVKQFQDKHGSLQAVVQPRFRHLGSGRIYDMGLGPSLSA